METYRALETIVDEKKTRHIGVSNYTEEHLRQLMEYLGDDVKHKPVVNQYELHPFLQQREITDFCEDNAIAIQSYSSLARADDQAFTNLTLVGIARRHGITVPQTMLLWCLGHRFSTIPKSNKKQRIVENKVDDLGITLTDEDMLAIDGLECNLRTCWNPYTITG